MSAAEQLDSYDITIPADIAERIVNAEMHQLPELWRVIELAFGNLGRRALCRLDRFYLLVSVLHRTDALDPWLYERCREVEADPDEHIDLWAREHYKSTIITFAGCIQEIIKDPEITIGIFSHTNQVSRKFLAQIKLELEDNKELTSLFSDIFYNNPKKEAPRWSLDAGLLVKRRKNPKEATIEGHGLVEGMPTGAHFVLRVYDDVVTRESVNTPDQIKKVSDAWELSDNLGARQDNGMPGRRWHIGTRYHFADTYGMILERQLLTPRIYPATHDGTVEGRPVFLSEEAWEHKKQNQTGSTLACQMLQNPLAGDQAMFDKNNLMFLEVRPATLNIYIMVDPASSRKKTSDYTAISVIAIDGNYNKILIDGVREKLKLRERWRTMRDLRKKWMRQPGIQNVYVGYERYGMQSDIEYFEERMEIEGEHFDITELNWPRDGEQSKYDRIQRLTADFTDKKFYLPAIVKDETSGQKRMREINQPWRILKPVRRYDHERKIYSLNKEFVIEYLTYPFSTHDDMLDSASRIYDMDVRAPVIIDDKHLEPEVYDDGV